MLLEVEAVAVEETDNGVTTEEYVRRACAFVAPRGGIAGNFAAGVEFIQARATEAEFRRQGSMTWQAEDGIRRTPATGAAISMGGTRPAAASRGAGS